MLTLNSVVQIRGCEHQLPLDGLEKIYISLNVFKNRPKQKLSYLLESKAHRWTQSKKDAHDQMRRDAYTKHLCCLFLFFSKNNSSAPVDGNTDVRKVELPGKTPRLR